MSIEKRDENVIAEISAHHPDGSHSIVAVVLARNRKLVVSVGTHPAPEIPAAEFVRALERGMEQVRQREELDP